MKHPLLVLVLSFVLISPVSSQPLNLEEHALRVGIDPGNVGISENSQRLLGGEGSLPMVQLLLAAPISAPRILEPMTAAVLNYEASPAAMFARTTSFGARQVFKRSSVDEILRNESPYGEGLPQILKQLTGSEQTQVIADWPIELRQALFIVLYAQLSANSWVGLAQQNLPPGAESNLWSLARVSDLDFNSAAPDIREAYWRYRQAINSFDPTPMVTAAEEILYAVEWAADRLRSLPADWLEGFSHVFKTPYGPIVIGSTNDDRHEFTDALLILELGGADYYSEGGSNDPSKQATSVLLDLDGSDYYESKRSAFGSGTFGIGVLWDAAGDDRYLTLDRSLGSAHFGVGVLVDRSGNDIYSGRAEVQGSAIAGMAMLFDGGGSDQYIAMLGAQGFGGPRGVATLVDLAGDDEYIARNSSSLFRSSKDKAHTLSLAQGIGFGFRADLTDGLSITGGVGVLIDREGSDRYVGGNFSQGAGYWFGAGILLDQEGDDNYRSYWYGQGVSAHFAAGVLIDSSGDDSHLVEERMGLGAAHDLGTAVFVDYSGDDIYRAADLTLGASSAAGNGIFLDRAGDDSYLTISPKSIGWIEPNAADDMRSGYDAFGLFIDAVGTDNFKQEFEERFVEALKKGDSRVARKIIRRN